VETATKTIEQMSESFAQPDVQESFSTWAERADKEARQEEKEKRKSSGSREIKLADRDEGERKFIEAVAQKDESKESAKDSRRESAAEKDAANRTEQHADAKKSEKPDAKGGEKPAASGSDDSPSEPLSGDLAERHWQGKLQPAEMEKHIHHVNSRAGIIMKHINESPYKAQLEDGFRALMAGRNSGVDKPGFFRDLATCLAEVASPAEVFHHITLQPQDREFVRNCKNPKELRAAIQTIAKHYPAAASQAAPKPRAPKPPSSVPGRSAASDDGVETNFRDLSTKMWSRYGLHT
jgi:hypothetical protein